MYGGLEVEIHQSDIDEFLEMLLDPKKIIEKLLPATTDDNKVDFPNIGKSTATRPFLLKTEVRSESVDMLQN